MPLVVLMLLSVACNGDRQRFDVKVVSEGEGEPSQQPLFHLHPDVLPGADLGWVEVDGRQVLRLNAAELTDHTLYDIGDDGSFYLAGLEQAPLETPSLWVPPEVRHQAEWYQPELDRTLYVERGFAPGEWVFQYAVAGMAPEVRTRVEDDPVGFYEAAPAAWSSRVLPWTSLGTVDLQPAEGNGSLFVEGPAGASLHVARWVQEVGADGEVVFAERYTDVDPTASPFTTAASPPRWPSADGFVEAVRAGGNPVVSMPVIKPATASFAPERVFRGSSADHADVYAVPGGGSGFEVASIGFVHDAAGLVGAIRQPSNLHESRIHRDGEVEVRYYTTTPSGRIDRYALTPEGWERTSLGRIALDAPNDQLSVVWERADGSLEGLIGMTGWFNLPDGIHFRIAASDVDGGEPVPVLPGVMHTEAKVLNWPSDDRLLCSDTAMVFEPPPGASPHAVADGCQLEFTHRERYTGTHDTLGPFRYDGYVSASALGNDAPVRYRLAPGHDGITLAIDASGDGFRMGFVFLDDNLFELSAIPGDDISNCRIAWPDGCWEQSAGTHRWHRMDGRVLSSSQQLGTLYVPADAPALRRAGSELSEVDVDGEWHTIDWPGGTLRFADARWLCVSEGTSGPMSCHSRSSDEVVSVPDELTAVGAVRVGADGVPVDPNTLTPLEGAEPIALSLANAWERDGVLYARGSETGEVLRYADGRNERAVLDAGPTPQAPFAATRHFLYYDGNRTRLDTITWQPLAP